VRLRRSGWIVWLRSPEPVGVLEATVLLGVPRDPSVARVCD
jgi:hypothetical protein